MYRISFAVFAILLIAGCANNSQGKHILSQKEFTKLYLDSLVRRYPALKFTMIDDSSIVSKKDSNEISIYSDNAFKEYQEDSTSLKEIISNHVSSVSNAFEINGEVNITKIVPLIRSYDFLRSIEGQGKGSAGRNDSTFAYKKYNDQLLIFYAEDDKNNLNFLTWDDLKQFHIQPDSLYRLAIKNLGAMMDSVQVNGGDGLYMIVAGGNYEASLILSGNIITKKNMPVKGDFIIAVPNRDLLLITGSDEKEGISKLKKIVEASYSNGSYPISEYLYQWNGKKFIKADDL